MEVLQMLVTVREIRDRRNSSKGTLGYDVPLHSHSADLHDLTIAKVLLGCYPALAEPSLNFNFCALTGKYDQVRHDDKLDQYREKDAIRNYTIKKKYREALAGILESDGSNHFEIIEDDPKRSEEAIKGHRLVSK